MAVTPARTLTTPQLIALLRMRYPPASHLVLEEVRNGAGFDATRSADALVMGLWPSRGLALEGFEVKRDRRDWLRELKNPAKADSMFAYCDRWWILANPQVALEGELPPTWGLLEATARGLRVVRVAPVQEPKPLARGVLAALLKRAWASRPAAQEMAALREQATQEARTNLRYEADQNREALRSLRANVQAFEQASGLRIEHGWDLAPLGAAVKRYLQDGLPGALTLRDFRERLVRILQEVDALSLP